MRVLGAAWVKDEDEFDDRGPLNTISILMASMMRSSRVSRISDHCSMASSILGQKEYMRRSCEVARCHPRKVLQ